MKPYSLLRRITVGLTATMLIAGLSSFGWLYLKAKWTDISLREQTLFEQARVIAEYLKLDGNNSITLNLPSRLAEAYSSPESEYHFAVRGENGQYLFDSGESVSALPVLSRSRQKLYDYDPDGPGPLRVFGAALRTEIGQRTVFVQVEQKTHDPDYLRMAVIDEFITDGGWLVIPFLLMLLGVSIWIVKRGLVPITQISALAETIGPNNANVRLPIDQIPLEILPLVQSMNAALDHLERGLQRQREFNANAAHQLRTPLSVLMANVDTLDELEIANRLRADVDQMSRIVSQLLLVARLETVSINLDEIVDLNDAAAEIAASLAPLALTSGKSSSWFAAMNLSSSVPTLLQCALRLLTSSKMQSSIRRREPPYDCASRTVLQLKSWTAARASHTNNVQKSSSDFGGATVVAVVLDWA